MVLTVSNHKGGVGKSTTAVNVAAALSRRGRRVLLLDLDSQCSAGLHLGVPKDTDTTLADVLFRGLAIDRAIHETAAGVDVAPASFELAEADIRLAGRSDRATWLRDALAPLRDRYGFILVDTPPSTGLLVVSAIIAADALLVPVTPAYLAVEGAVNFFRTLDLVREGFETPARVLGIVLTACDYRTGHAREYSEMIRQHFGRLVFQTEIRQSVRLAEAPSFGRSVLDHAGTSAAAESYISLAAEILSRSRRQENE